MIGGKSLSYSKVFERKLRMISKISPGAIPTLSLRKINSTGNPRPAITGLPPMISDLSRSVRALSCTARPPATQLIYQVIVCSIMD
jgi:hypothetical protein